MFLNDISSELEDASYLHNKIYKVSTSQLNLEREMWDVMVPYDIFVFIATLYISFKINAPYSVRENNQRILDSIDRFIINNRRYISSTLKIEQEAYNSLDELLKLFKCDSGLYRNFLDGYIEKLSRADKREFEEFAKRFSKTNSIRVGYRSDHYRAHAKVAYHKNMVW